MFIKNIKIENYRLFRENFEIDSFNIPNGAKGSGVTLLVGENGCGKTTVLDAISLCTLEYKAKSFGISDFNYLKNDSKVVLKLDEQFEVKKTLNGSFFAEGFIFKSNIRKQKSGSYLQSPVVSDQLYIGVDLTNPKSGSPDLRVNVFNPFSGKRFDDLEILYLDRNRLFQIKSGSFSETKFDKLMADFNAQYLNKHKDESIPDINSIIKSELKESIKNEFLNEAIKKFSELSNLNIRLDFFNNNEPFNTASFVLKGEVSDVQISLNSIGVGYEMVFSFLYSYYLAKQNNKKIIMLMDEPELHLHPSLQKKFIDFLLDISEQCQIILTSHSPILVKQLLYNDNVKTIVLNNDKTQSEISDFRLTYLSANEINYLAFGLATEEYHNELYEEIKNTYCPEKSIKAFDNEFFVVQKKQMKNYMWKGRANEVSIYTYIRNQIHHRKENGNPDYDKLKKSIEFMRTCL